MFWAICADAITAFHAAYVGFVVIGELAILVGAAFRMRWARNPWLRWIHFAAIAVVALEGYMHWDCPLTVWEYQCREWAGQVTTGETFVGRLVHLIFMDGPDNQFEPWVYEYIHIAFGVLVLATMVFLPPRWRRTPRAVTCASTAVG